jgi:hypothetical protein
VGDAGGGLAGRSIRFDPLDMPVTGISGWSKQKSRSTDAVFLPIPGIDVSQSRAASGLRSPRNSSE